MECEVSGARWQRIAGCLLVAIGLVGGCAGESDSGGDEDPTSEADTAVDTRPEIVISESCETACQNFADKCGDRTPATQADCEYECEQSWSEDLADCVRAASACHEIEVCDQTGGSMGDTGTTDGSASDTGTTDGRTSDGGTTGSDTAGETGTDAGNDLGTDDGGD